MITPKGHMLRSLILILTLTLLDVSVVEAYYRPRQAWGEIWVWHLIFYTAFMLLPAALTITFRSLAYLLAYPYFFFGIEDTMFYLLGHRFIPDLYLGVKILGVSEPTKRFVLQANVAGLMLMILIGYFGFRIYPLSIKGMRGISTRSPWKRVKYSPERRRLTLSLFTLAVILAFTYLLILKQPFHRWGTSIEEEGTAAPSKTITEEAEGYASKTLPASTLTTTSTSTMQLNAWRSWAEVAWRYYQPGVGVNPRTLLHYASLDWPEFTDWDLASYILALLDAEELGIIKGTPTFQERVERILRFLMERELTSEGLPYWAYFADSGLPDKRWGATNPSDTGRLLIALSKLKERRQDLAPLIDYIVYQRCDYEKLLLDSSWGSGFYRYYAAQGFKAFDFQYSLVSESLRDMEKLSEGRFIKLYGEEIPLTWVTSEPLLHGILDLDLNGLFRDYADRIYRVQERRFREDGRLTAFSEGAYGGYVYEWIVRGDTGETWRVTRIRGDRVENLNVTPAVFTKVAFALHAIYSTEYTRVLVSELLNAQVQISKGFLEGVTEDGEIIPSVTDKTNAMIINAALYALQHAQSERVKAGGMGEVDGSLLQCMEVKDPTLGFTAQGFNPSISLKAYFHKPGIPGFHREES